MEAVLDSTNMNLNWAAKGTDRIIQNVLNLINTWRYDVAYDRTMGLDPQILDLPAEKASALYVSEIYRIIPLYEPRATVKEVRMLSIDSDGQLQYQVVIEI